MKKRVSLILEESIRFRDTRFLFKSLWQNLSDALSLRTLNEIYTE